MRVQMPLTARLHACSPSCTRARANVGRLRAVTAVGLPEGEPAVAIFKGRRVLLLWGRRDRGGTGAKGPQQALRHADWICAGPDAQTGTSTLAHAEHAHGQDAPCKRNRSVLVSGKQS